MFYDLDLKIGFIHIPRTGGVAITQAFKPYLGLGGGWDLGVMRHLPLQAMQNLLKDASIRYFTVIRPFDAILDSYQQLIARDRYRLLTDPEAQASFSQNWKQILLAEKPLLETWKQAGWPTDENQWWEFWLKGNPAVEVRKLRFECLHDDLFRLCLEWQLPPVELPKDKMN